MKANKVTLIVQAIGMYLMHLPLYILLIVSSMPSDALMETLTKGLLIATLVLMAVLFPVCVANIVMSVAAIFKGDIDLSKTVMTVKLALIPWYGMNFAIGVVFVAISLNPFMMIGIPVEIAILAGTAYFYMLATSLPNAAYCLRNVFITKKEKLTASRIVALVFLFIFCLDVVGSILFYRQNKNAALLEISASEIPEDK